MKVCFLCSSMSECGGVQRVTTILADALAEEYEVTLLAINNFKGRFFYQPSDKVRCESWNYFSFSRKRLITGAIRRLERKYPVILPGWLAKAVYFPDSICRKLSRKLLEDQYDCVIASGGHPSLLLGLLRSYLPETKLIGWQHNSFQIYFETRETGFYIQRNLAVKALSCLDDIVALTKHDAAEYRKKMNLPAQWIYNPLSFESEMKSDVSHKALLYVGRMDLPHKGLDFLIDIMRILVVEKGRRDWILFMVGDGADLPEVKKKARKAGIADHVLFEGEQSAVIPYYLKSSVFLCTSRWEGFGLVVTEAMECGLPVVSFETDGPSEIIENGKNGFLIPKYDLHAFADAADRLMEDEALRKSMSAASVIRAKDFHIESILERWKKILEE